MQERIKVIIKEPSERARLVEIDNTLEELQGIIGGYIETVTLASNAVAICDEEGRWKGLPQNFCLCGIDFVGTVIFTGADLKTGELTDFPGGLETFRLVFREADR